MPNNGYFDTIFAVNGDLNTVPDGTQTNGTVSYNQGFGILYSTPVSSGGYDFPRSSHNQLLNDITAAIQQLQQVSVPSFITSSMNGGTPFSYSAGNMVISGGVIYISLVNSNTDTPPSAKWGFVNIGAYSGYVNISSNTTLDATYSGKFLQDTKTGGSTITLPAASSYTGGRGLTILGNGSTIATQGSDYCVVTFIPAGNSIQFVSNGSNQWVTLGATTAGVQSLGTTGYQQYAGGTILQWGSASSIPSGGNAAVTFPITFPTNIFNAWATIKPGGNFSTTYTAGAGNFSLGGMNIYGYDGLGTGFSASWLAIGD